MYAVGLSPITRGAPKTACRAVVLSMMPSDGRMTWWPIGFRGRTVRGRAVFSPWEERSELSGAAGSRSGRPGVPRDF